MSQASASSQPPPSAYPLTAAMIGLLQPAIASPSRRPISEKARISSADSPTISLISAPATNALSPPPVRMIAPTSAAIERCSNVIESSRRTEALSAFMASGRSIVTIASRSSISTRMKPGMGTLLRRTNARDEDERSPMGTGKLNRSDRYSGAGGGVPADATTGLGGRNRTAPRCGVAGPSRPGEGEHGPADMGVRRLVDVRYGFRNIRNEHALDRSDRHGIRA